MASILESSSRLIECPEDLSDCQALDYNGKRLMYFVINRNSCEAFIVVLGFFSGQIKDGVTKDLIEVVQENGRLAIRERILSSFPRTVNVRIMFL